MSFKLPTKPALALSAKQKASVAAKAERAAQTTLRKTGSKAKARSAAAKARATWDEKYKQRNQAKLDKYNQLRAEIKEKLPEVIAELHSRGISTRYATEAEILELARKHDINPLNPGRGAWSAKEMREKLGIEVNVIKKFRTVAGIQSTIRGTFESVESFVSKHSTSTSGYSVQFVFAHTSDEGEHYSKSFSSGRGAISIDDASDVSETRFQNALEAAEKSAQNYVGGSGSRGEYTGWAVVHIIND